MPSSRDFDTFDRCERRYAFEQKWEPRILSPSALLYGAFEAAVSSPDPEGAAKAESLRLASKYDILTNSQPYDVASHMGWLAGIIATHLVLKHGKLRPATLPESDPWNWETSVWQDREGALHRFALVDHWDEDRLSAEAHSWYTIAELVALRQPLTLHGIVVGPSRGGKRHSPWTKGFIHPMTRGTVKNIGSLGLRFAPRKRSNRAAGFNENWAEVWREIRTDIPTSHWLESMQRDNVLPDLIHSRTMAYNDGDIRLSAAERDMMILKEQMDNASVDAPMRRSSCDAVGRGACPFQAVCYAAKAITLKELPALYRDRSQERWQLVA